MKLVKHHHSAARKIIKPRGKSPDAAVVLGQKRSLPRPRAGVKATFHLKKILVPLDFSGCDHKVLQYAVPFARQFGAELTLLHVLAPYIPTPDMIATPVESVESAMARLRVIQKSLDSKVSASLLVRHGPPYVEIITAAKQQGTDLIIVATHARKGIEHMLLGSVAEKLVRHAGCPVLIVREHEHEFIN